MPRTQFKTLKHHDSKVVCDQFDLSDDAKARLESGDLDLSAPPAEFVDRLVEFGLFIDAVRFVAYALPNRESIWWSTRCIRESVAIADELSCLPLAEDWVIEPGDDLGRAAMDAAEEAKFATPDTWAGVATFWSGESIAPVEAPVVPPGDEFAGHAVAGAVMLAAVHDDPARAEERYRQFLEIASAISTGRDTWEDSGGR